MDRASQLPDNMLPSSQYLLMMEAACVVIEKFTLDGNLYQGCIILKRETDGAIYHISEADWTYLLPDAIDQVGKNCNLTDTQYARLNDLITEREFSMGEMGFSNSYPIPLDTQIPTEHDPADDEDFPV